jgi:hypothetical protein
MIRRLATVVALVIVVAACSGGGTKTVHLNAGGAAHSGPDPYDVDAARLCKALFVYIRDAKANHASTSDSQGLEKAEAKLKAGHDSLAKWAPLAANVDTLILYANQGNASDFPLVGLKIGQQCATIPSPAQKAAGYT